MYSSTVDRGARFDGLLLGLLAVLSMPSANAGSIAVVAAVMQMFEIFFWVVIGGSAVAVLLCQRIRAPRQRALWRLLILVALYAPVIVMNGGHEAQVLPAFLAFFNQGNGGPHEGALSHPILLAYGATLLVTLPILMLWMHVEQRYRRGVPVDLDTSEAERASNASNPPAAIPPR